MREIKFRAFYEGKIYQVGDIRFEAKEVCLWNGKGTEFNFIDTSKVALMQFTGLKDKNNTEIYEGDIVRDKVGRVWSVGYSERFACFLFYYKGNKKSYQNYMQFIRVQLPFEIIGNIHQNPELLKK